MQQLLPVVWVHAVYLDVAKSRLMKKQRNFHLADIPSMKEIIFHLTVQQVRFTRVISKLRKLKSVETLEELWVGLTNTESFWFVQMQIHRLIHRRLLSLVQKVSVFAVQSICSLVRTESLSSEE